tara:strand:- start:1094 stop:1381 length:288 start_codon:yes stop_codon:yes gene_type:complete
MLTEEERELKEKKKVYRQKYYNKLKQNNPTQAQQYSREWWKRNRDTWKAYSKLAIKNPVDTFNAESSFKVSFEGVDDTSDPKLFLELLKKRNECS